MNSKDNAAQNLDDLCPHCGATKGVCGTMSDDTWEIPGGKTVRSYPTSEGVPTLTEAYQEGWDNGHNAGAEQTEEYRNILADLLVELRDMFGTHEGAYERNFGEFPIGSTGDEVRDYLDRAEARMRKVNTDE